MVARRPTAAFPESVLLLLHVLQVLVHNAGMGSFQHLCQFLIESVMRTKDVSRMASSDTIMVRSVKG
jgi:hypothetical protein